MVKNSSSPEEKKVRELRDKVHSWLLADDFSVREVNSPDTYWLLVASRSDNADVGIGLKLGTNKIVVTSDLMVADWQATRLSTMSSTERAQVIHELRILLLQMDIDFSGVDFPLKDIFVTKGLLADDLSRREFLSSVRLVRRALMAAIFTVQHRLGAAS